jgi:hypothetical protein
VRQSSKPIVGWVFDGWVEAERGYFERLVSSSVARSSGSMA